jgi:hypothetical protein
LRRRDDVLFRRLPNAVLARPRDGSLMRLRGSGADLWDELEQPRTIAELTAALADRFAADPVTVDDDIAPVIESLVEARVLGWT